MGGHVFFPGILYAVGGYDGATRQCLSTVEAYNPKSNTWSYIAEMGTRRSGAGVCVCVRAVTHRLADATQRYWTLTMFCAPQVSVC